MNRKFYGYKRADGSVGIRNHVLVMPAVLCVDTPARKIAAKTGAKYISNPIGCGQNPKDTAVMLDVLSGLIANANVFGIVIVGLGCEFLTEDTFRQAIRAKCDKPVRYVCMQRLGGYTKTIEEGIRLATELQAEAAKMQRIEADFSDLILGLECGGSDPTSGFSANTVLGVVTDGVIDSGGSAILSETVEAIGAEHILRDRGRTKEIGDSIYRAVIDWERSRFSESGRSVREGNPSPGNLAGGISTLSEKSLGCIHKAGSRPFDGCCEYGKWIREKGLYFLNAPSFDVLNVTALAAAGAQLVAFTTGLGNPIGNPVAPVVKITGNADTAKNLFEIIDIDTSASIRGEKTVGQCAKEMADFFADVCSGKECKAECNGSDEMCLNQCYSFE